MNEKKFTDDNEFNELKKLLKELPKVDTPDNFEFNLMTKIQNKNFEVKSEKKKSWFSWALTPAIGFAATVFLVFSVFFNDDSPTNNILETPPKLIEQSVAETSNSNIVKEQRVNAKSQEMIGQNSRSQSLVATNNKREFPFDKNTSINFDEYLRSDNEQTARVGAQLAGSQTSQISPFDGFFLRQRREVQKRDSIMRENDSLNQKDLLK